MKKALATITALGAAGIAAVLLLKNVDHSGSLASASMLPPETIFLIDAPDLKGSALRWQETAIAKIGNEPEVKAFLQRPLSQLFKNPIVEDTLNRLGRVGIDQGFLALTGIRENMPHVVMGIRYSGSRAELEGLIARAKAEAQHASPAGKLDLLKHGQYEIESFTDKGTTVAGALVGQWYFVSNQVDLLKSTIDRYASPSASPALGGSELYKKTVAPLPKHPDIQFFARTEGLADKWATLAAASGTTVDAQQLDELRKIKGISAASKLEGPLVREVAFVYAPESKSLPTLNGSTLALTSPETLIYYGNAMVFPDKINLGGKSASSPFAASLQSFLKGIDSEVPLENLGKAFGPEFAFILDWKPTSLAPTAAAVINVKDAPLALQFANGLLKDWIGAENNGTHFWRLPNPSTGGLPISVSPTAALTNTHFVIGLDSATVDATLNKAAAAASGKEAVKTLIHTPTFEAAYGTVQKPGTGLVYVDTKVLFEKIYGLLRPMAAYANLIPGISDYADLSKLPSTEAISQHLLPNIISTAQVENGLRIEATGAISSVQTALAAQVGAVAYVYSQGLKLTPAPSAIVAPTPPTLTPPAVPEPAPATPDATPDAAPAPSTPEPTDEEPSTPTPKGKGGVKAEPAPVGRRAE